MLSIGEGAVLIPPCDVSTGALPLGRFPSTLDEIEATFVVPFPTSARRPLVWDHFRTATSLLQEHLHVSNLWLGGSFLTTKPEPDDVDVVYWAEDVDIQSVASDPDSARIVQVFAQSGIKAALGLQVDTFVVPWRSNPESAPRGPDDLNYYRVRGYWDDLWVRLRAGAKGAPRSRLDSIPRRGYLEVALDGFPER